MRIIKLLVPKYSESQVQKFTNENEFMDASVELLKQTIECLFYLVHAKYCDEDEEFLTLSKDDAVVGGNLVRLIKLNTSFLQNICENKIEICSILNRCIAETSINILYMLTDSEERVKRNYIKHSLITEKQLWETIKSNIKERKGDILNIETRMQNSIERSFDNSDFELDEVSRSSKWVSVKGRAELVAGELFYSVFYGIGSHAVHGNWQDILSNHLDKHEDGFKLHLEWRRSRPQIIDGPVLFNLDVMNKFVKAELPGYSHFEILKSNYLALMTYAQILNKYHEELLTNQNGL
jgi:hypothetical protein